MKKLSSYKNESDEELIASYKKSGEQTYVGELFERYLSLVYGVCLKYLKDAERSHDLSMELYEKMLGDLKKYEIQNFKSWLYQVVKSQCLLFLRKESAQSRHEEAVKRETGVMEFAPDEHPEDDSLLQASEPHLQWALHQLDEQQRICLDLFYLQNKSYAEITERTGFSFNQVKSFIQNGKRNLKILLTKKYGQHI